MRYIKEILKNNKLWVLAYIGLGIFNAFMANYKTDYFQKVIDGLASEVQRTLQSCVDSYQSLMDLVTK